MTDQIPEPIAPAEIYFAPSTNAFYDLAVWSAPLPADAVQVSAEDYAAMLAAEATGLRRMADADGRPVAVAPPPPTSAELADQARRRRDAEVTAWRWMIERHRDEIELDQAATLTPAQFAALLAYVQALRDVPAQPGFPAAITWPTPPFDPSTTENI
ncbi:phage tail assembly chaperone [Brevundimonas faecalis]|uniref:phage tail assembly chaperone n=1 Tax=Brevundimonas faecalis TaxID=947378 RepID=UPI00360BB66F